MNTSGYPPRTTRRSTHRSRLPGWCERRVVGSWRHPGLASGGDGSDTADEDDSDLAASAIAEADRERVLAEIRRYHENLPTLLVALYFGTRFVTDESATAAGSR